ncbi:MAG: hypothetical protein M3M96_00995 [Candidatus Eremiobacteraeota bacterium]|nr:hypothetical protein [Candidatus Eremiobacteraeota bacterium]
MGTRSVSRFDETFGALKTLFDPYVPRLHVRDDTATAYTLYGETAAQFKGPMYFGGVRLGRNYVSFYLMPVYTNPELLSKASDDLRKRMQGKSCFNFVRPDVSLFEELRELTGRGFTLYATLGWVA